MNIETDLTNRDRLRRYLNERSLESVGDHFGISTSAVWLGERRPLAVLSAEQNAELQKLRAEYHEARQEFDQLYRLRVLAKKYGHRVQWVCKKRRKMLDQKAELVYGRRAA